jgi:hypothetical protein
MRKGGTDIGRKGEKKKKRMKKLKKSRRLDVDP